jgi:hypothetical protein
MQKPAGWRAAPLGLTPFPFPSGGLTFIIGDAKTRKIPLTGEDHDERQ